MIDKKKDYKAWLYLAPAIIAILLFTIYPIISTVITSFNHGYNPIMSNPWNHAGWGFGNYSELFGIKGAQFQTALLNTSIIVFVSVPLTTIVALLIAVGLNSIKPFQRFFQIIFFTPYVTNTIAIGMVFAMVFGSADAGGMINGLFKGNTDYLGLGSPFWLKHLVLQIYMLWNGLAFKILIFLGGLQNIGDHYYNAARIDGTSKGRMFSKITLPLLSPTITYILITSVIGAFKTYTAVVGLFANSAAANEMMTIVGFVYENINTNYGLAAAGSVVLFIIIMIFTGIQALITRKKVHF